MSTGALLRTISVALASTTSESLKLPKKGTKRQTIGDFYREYSRMSTHELDVSKQTLYTQLKALVMSNNSIVDALGPALEPFLDEAVKEFRSNILAKVRASPKKYKLLGGSIISTTVSGDNFQAVRDLVNAGFNTTNAYKIDKFINKVAEQVGADVSNITLGTKFGLDIGHYHSNIISAYGAIIFNSLRRAKNLDLSSDELIKSIDTLDKSLQDPAIVSELMQRSGITDQEVFMACIDATVGLTKRIVNNKLEVILKAEPKLDSTVIKKVAQQIKDKVFPEASISNQLKGASFEKSLSNHLSSVSTGYFLKLFNEIAIGKHTDLINLEGSKPAKEIVLDFIEDIVLRGKSSSVGSSTPTKVKPSKKTVNISKGTKTNTNKTTAKKTSVPKLRNLSGQYTSVTNLELLIRKMLTATVIKNMERPNLENQTGRFARSVELKSISQRSNTLQLFLTYMKYPYQTFEPGFKQGHKGYDPRRLIDQSVREIATKLVKARLQTVVV